MLINNTSSVDNTNELLSPSVRNDNFKENPYDEFEDQNKIEVDSEGPETFRSPSHGGQPIPVDTAHREQHRNRYEGINQRSATTPAVRDRG